MMQKNEHRLLEHWWRYHAALFGAENLYLFDNGSTDERAIEQLRAGERNGVVVDRSYNEKRDFEAKGSILGDHAVRLAASYDFFLFLDCDEFIALARADGSISCRKEDILSYLTTFKDAAEVLRIKGAFLNLIGPGHKYRFWSESYAKKTYFAALSFKSIDVGFHDGKSSRSDLEIVTDLVHIHFQNKPYAELLASAREKLSARVSDFDAATLRAYRGPGMHLANYFLIDEEHYLRINGASDENTVCIPEFLEQLHALGLRPPYDPVPSQAQTSKPAEEKSRPLPQGSRQNKSLPLRMTQEEAALFKSIVSCSSKYMEFGAGGTTCLASELTSGWVISVDSSKEWIQAVLRACQEKHTGTKPWIIHVDLGPTKDWGYPTDNSRRSSWPGYHQDIWSTSPAAEADVFLVDGRFRVACTMQILARCNPHALIAIHDFSSRSQYHIVTEFARKVAQAGDLTVFLPEIGGKHDDLARILADYQYDPA